VSAWKIIFIGFIVGLGLYLSGCATIVRGRPVDDIMRDAALIAEQQRTIDELRIDNERMGQIVGELQTGIRSISSGIADGIASIERSIERGDGLAQLFTDIDLFVRRVINENTRLRELERRIGNPHYEFTPGD